MTPSDYPQNTPKFKIEDALNESRENGYYSCLSVNLNHLQNNYEILKALSFKLCGATVKSNAYGLGAIPIARALYHSGCRHFFVAFLDEGIALRAALPFGAPIYIYNGCLSGWQTHLTEHNLIPVLCTLDQIHLWKNHEVTLGKNLPCALFIDTGMHRTGISIEESTRYKEHLNTMHIRLIISHLACADDPKDPFNHAQLRKFNQIRPQFPGIPVSFLNSSGLFLDSEFKIDDISRPGMGLYGLNPTQNPHNVLHFIADIWARVVQIHTVSKGESVGYSQFFKANRHTKIATIACGYADGIPWRLTQGSFSIRVQIGEFFAPIVGFVSMDLITVDVTDVPDSILESEVWFHILGEFNYREWTIPCQTTVYETLTRLHHRYKRIYIT